MSARNTTVQLITKAGTLFGALFLVGVLLAAIPAHKSQPTQFSKAQESQSAPTNTNTMPGMDRVINTLLKPAPCTTCPQTVTTHTVYICI